MLITYAAWCDWQQHAHLQPLQCIYYHADWWRLQRHNQSWEVIEPLQVRYLSNLCIVLAIPPTESEPALTIPIWFDTMPQEDFYDIIRFSLAYTNDTSVGVNMVGWNVADVRG